VNESFDSFNRWFWISVALTIVFVALLFFVTRRRDLWLRYIAVEAGFWMRLGVPARIAEASRRFEASRVFIGFLWFIVVLWLLLVLANGGAYLYFKSQLPPLRGPNIPAIDEPRQPPG
jgi:hypothetical protein